MTIYVDTREKLPYWTGPKIVRRALLVGDYTTESLQGIYHIERKSLEDLYGTLTAGKIRFLRECLRAKKAGVKMEMVIEGRITDFMALKFKGGNYRECPPHLLERRIRTITATYSIVFHWCSNRQTAKRLVRTLLVAKERYYHEN